MLHYLIIRVLKSVIFESQPAILLSLLVVARISRRNSRNESTHRSLLGFLDLLLEALIPMLQLNELLAHFVRVTVFFSVIALNLLVALIVGLRLLVLVLQLLRYLGKLQSFLALLNQLLLQLLVLNLHLLDDRISLLELFLDDFQLLRVGESVLGLDDFFKLLAQAGTLLNVELDLYLDLLLASRPYVFA